MKDKPTITIDMVNIINDIVDLLDRKVNTYDDDEIKYIKDEIDKRMYLLDYLIPAKHKLSKYILDYLDKYSLYSQYLHSEEDIKQLKELEENINKELKQLDVEFKLNVLKSDVMI